VYSNVKKRRLSLITGMATFLAVVPSDDTSASVLSGSVPDGYILEKGLFYSECEETCFISFPVSKEKPAKLIIEFSEGTTVTISQLIYTTL